MIPRVTSKLSPERRLLPSTFTGDLAVVYLIQLYLMCVCLIQAGLLGDLALYYSIGPPPALFNGGSI
jgi:hypothetical protein